MKQMNSRKGNVQSLLWICLNSELLRYQGVQNFAKNNTENAELASKMLKQCDSAAKAVICFAYRCSASSHALAAAISASLQGERGSVSSRAQRQHDFSFASWRGKRKRFLARLSTGMISAMLYEKREICCIFLSKT